MPPDITFIVQRKTVKSASAVRAAALAVQRKAAAAVAAVNQNNMTYNQKPNAAHL